MILILNPDLDKIRKRIEQPNRPLWDYDDAFVGPVSGAAWSRSGSWSWFQIHLKNGQNSYTDTRISMKGVQIRERSGAYLEPDPGPGKLKFTWISDRNITTLFGLFSSYADLKWEMQVCTLLSGFSSLFSLLSNHGIQPNDAPTYKNHITNLLKSQPSTAYSLKFPFTGI